VKRCGMFCLETREEFLINIHEEIYVTPLSNIYDSSEILCALY